MMNWVEQLLAMPVVAMPRPRQPRPGNSINYRLTGKMLKPYKPGAWRYAMVQRLRQQGYITSPEIEEMSSCGSLRAASSLITRLIDQKVLIRSEDRLQPHNNGRPLTKYYAGPNARCSDDVELVE